MTPYALFSCYKPFYIRSRHSREEFLIILVYNFIRERARQKQVLTTSTKESDLLV